MKRELLREKQRTFFSWSSHGCCLRRQASTENLLLGGATSNENKNKNKNNNNNKNKNKQMSSLCGQPMGMNLESNWNSIDESYKQLKLWLRGKNFNLSDWGKTRNIHMLLACSVIAGDRRTHINWRLEESPEFTISEGSSVFLGPKLWGLRNVGWKAEMKPRGFLALKNT